MGIAIKERIYNETGNLGSAKKQRTGIGGVKDMIQSEECSSRRDTSHRESAIGR
jgi:hypothetical protein